MSPPKGRILCTEDDADTRDLINAILKSAGYEVQCAENAREALELAETQTFDLYLLDSWLPDIAGASLAAVLRRFNRDTPILFYSGAAYEKDKALAFGAGAQGYLTKPVDNDQLIAEVERLIATSRSGVA